MSAKQVLLGGGTGFIGQRLTQILKAKGYDVTIISRMPGLKRITWHQLNSDGIPYPNTVAVINLAGQNVLDPSRRWTAGFKQNVWNSRINTTTAMVRAIGMEKEKKDSQNQNLVFINISGISGYPCDNKEHDESEELVGTNFMSKLCIEWEKAADLPTEWNHCRLVKIRSGVVLGRSGGMIKNLYLPFYFGLGGPIGTGDQPLPWIHIDDLCQMMIFAIERKDVAGVLNGVAPQLITNMDFSKQFASSMCRPAAITLHKNIVDAIFNEERSVLLTSGQKVVPKKSISLGFKFLYPTIESACRELVK